MKIKHFAVLLLIVAAATGCKEDSPEPVPVAPILKYVVMPSESNSIPGTDVMIEGRGFSPEDVFTCKSLDGEKDFTSEAVKADNWSVTIRVPQEACGNYSVAVTRNGLTTTLPEKLYVAYIVNLQNIELPAAVVKPGQSVTIKAKGLAEGDEIRMESSSYPAGVKLSAKGTVADNTLTFTIPANSYGENSLTVVRGKRVGALGTIKIGVDLFAKTAGGIVFYTTDGGVHGLAVHTAAIGDAAMNWGPSIPNNFAAGSSQEIYEGKKNTSTIVAKEAEAKLSYTYTHSTPADLCDELSVEQNGVTYNDWFLPSLKELIELFKVKASVAEAGFSVPFNNYWTSTEYDYSGGWVWAMYYVNFYEATNIVYNGCNRVEWAIGTLAVRQF